MLTSSIAEEKKWDYSKERFRKALHFLKTTDFTTALPGSVIEIGDGIHAEVQEYDTKDARQCRFESHRKYFDIQYVASGEENMGYIKQGELMPDEGYDQSMDLEFYKEPRQSGFIHLSAGDFAIVSPDDGHKPRCIGKSPCRVRKIVVKVPVE